MRRLAATAAVALAAASPALAAGWRIVGQHWESGSFAIVASSANVKHPQGIEFKVTSSRPASTSGHWYLKCDGKVAQADFTVKPPVTKALPVPKGAKSCVAVVNATLATGRMTVTILAR